MIEPNDILFPELDAAMASFPGFETEETFRGWLRNSITKDNPIGDTIHRLIDVDDSWQLVYRLVAMDTETLEMICGIEGYGDGLQIRHEVAGNYSYGSSPKKYRLLVPDFEASKMLAAIGVLVQIAKFIDSHRGTKNDTIPEPEPEEEPKPKPKTTPKKKVTANEPSGDGGEATAEDPDAVRGETGNV